MEDGLMKYSMTMNSFLIAGFICLINMYPIKIHFLLMHTLDRTSFIESKMIMAQPKLKNNAYNNYREMIVN